MASALRAASRASSPAWPRARVSTTSSGPARSSSRDTARTSSGVTRLAFGFTISVARTREPLHQKNKARAARTRLSLSCPLPPQERCSKRKTPSARKTCKEDSAGGTRVGRTGSVRPTLPFGGLLHTQAGLRSPDLRPVQLDDPEAVRVGRTPLDVAVAEGVGRAGCAAGLLRGDEGAIQLDAVPPELEAGDALLRAGLPGHGRMAVRGACREGADDDRGGRPRRRPERFELRRVDDLRRRRRHRVVLVRERDERRAVGIAGRIVVLVAVVGGIARALVPVHDES